MAQKLKCVITIEGEKDSQEVNVKFAFTPPLLRNDENDPWDNCAALQMVGSIKGHIEAIKEEQEEQDEPGKG